MDCFYPLSMTLLFQTLFYRATKPKIMSIQYNFLLTDKRNDGIKKLKNVFIENRTTECLDTYLIERQDKISYWVCSEMTPHSFQQHKIHELDTGCLI